jgi:hypothetical protein
MPTPENSDNAPKGSPLGSQPEWFRCLRQGFLLAAMLGVTPAFAADPDNGEQLVRRSTIACPLHKKVADRQFHVRKTIYPRRRATKQAGISTSPHTTITDSNETARVGLLVSGSKTEYDKFKDADASYQHRDSHKIVIKPTSSMHHDRPPSPRRKTQDWHFMLNGR